MIDPRTGYVTAVCPHRGCAMLDGVQIVNPEAWTLEEWKPPPLPADLKGEALAVAIMLQGPYPMDRRPVARCDRCGQPLIEDGVPRVRDLERNPEFPAWARVRT